MTGYLILSLGLTAACGRSQISEKNREARQRLNERDYAGAVAALSEKGPPLDQEGLHLLAQSELGLGGFELLVAVREALSEQNLDVESHNWLKTDKCPPGKIDTKVSGKVPAVCILKRLEALVSSLHGPQAERSRHLLRAHELYKKHFADIDAQSADLNFEVSVSAALAALIHWKSVQDPSFHQRAMDYGSSSEEARITFENDLIHHIKAFLTATSFGLRSLRGSYSKVAQLLKAQDGRTLLSIHGVALVMSPTMGPDDLQKFVLDLALSVNAQFQRSTQDAAQKALEALVQVSTGSDLDHVWSALEPHQARVISVAGGFAARFLPTLSTLVLGRNPFEGRQYKSLMDTQAFPKHPLTKLGRALQQAWHQESSLPVRHWSEQSAAWIRAGEKLAARSEQLVSRSQTPVIAEPLTGMSVGYTNSPHFRLPTEEALAQPAATYAWLKAAYVDWSVWSLEQAQASQEEPLVLWLQDLALFWADFQIWHEGEVPPERSPARAAPPIKASRRANPS